VASKLNVVTGGRGLLGSHLVEQLVARGERVRALVRPDGDTDFLRKLGVELAVGDLGEPRSVEQAVDGADVVYHCAARVGDWGPWSRYLADTVDATHNLLEACRRAAVGRVLHVSSITVYGHPSLRDGPVTEEEPLGQNLWLWDHYCRAKIRAEELCRQYEGDLTIVRPTWLYGPRDRNTFPRVIAAIETGKVALIGSGDNPINILYAADLAEGAILAANLPAARGQVYNLSNEGGITQRQLLDQLMDLLGRPRITRRIPYAVAHWTGLFLEALGRVAGSRRPPPLTRYAVSLVGRPTRFSSAKARMQLGWRPRVGPEEGLRRTLEWYRHREQTPLVLPGG
jgi:nucleoside-diphosphate-sugar epimerase